MRINRLISGFKYGYPQSFLDQLAKDLGFKWIKVKFNTFTAEDVSISPMPPPLGILFYSELKFNDDDRKGV